MYHELDVLDLTQTLIRMRSVSRWSNAQIAGYVQTLLEAADWQVERTTYIDDNGELKVNLVAKLGEGQGGLAFCSHIDTVPGQEQDWPAFEPELRDGKLFGRGSCDMKGPFAATVVATSGIDAKMLKKPIYIVLTADEELGLQGAARLIHASHMLRRDRPDVGIIAEPTDMIPVYSHKGYARIVAEASGRAAHSATGRGKSAMLKMAPFIGWLAELDQMLQSDASFQNEDYDPPHHTLNFTVDHGGSALNVTAPTTTVVSSIRAMPNSRTAEIVDMIMQKGESLGLKMTADVSDALLVDPSAEIVQLCVELTGKQPETVSYGTDGNHLQEVIDELVVLGPGHIDVAHTVGEYIPLVQLSESVDIYRALIQRLCY